MIRVVTKQPGLVNEPKIQEIESGLDSMQRLVTPAEFDRQDNIELVRLPELAPHGIDLYVNEEGKFNGCQANFMIFNGQDVVMGPVFFVGSKDGETIGLTDRQVAVVLQFLATIPTTIF